MQRDIILGMTPPLNPEQQAAFADALVREIKAELGRRDWSSRELGRQIGQSSQYVSMRLDGGNSRTGRRVAMTIQDVAAIASALRMEPEDLMHRATAAVYSDLSAPADTYALAADDTDGMADEAEADETP